MAIWTLFGEVLHSEFPVHTERNNSCMAAAPFPLSVKKVGKYGERKQYSRCIMDHQAINVIILQVDNMEN